MNFLGHSLMGPVEIQIEPGSLPQALSVQAESESRCFPKSSPRNQTRQGILLILASYLVTSVQVAAIALVVPFHTRPMKWDNGVEFYQLILPNSY